VAVEFHEKVKV